MPPLTRLQNEDLQKSTLLNFSHICKIISHLAILTLSLIQNHFAPCNFDISIVGKRNAQGEHIGSPLQTFEIQHNKNREEI